MKVYNDEKDYPRERKTPVLNFLEYFVENGGFAHNCQMPCFPPCSMTSSKSSATEVSEAVTEFNWLTKSSYIHIKL